MPAASGFSHWPRVYIGISHPAALPQTGELYPALGSAENNCNAQAHLRPSGWLRGVGEEPWGLWPPGDLGESGSSDGSMQLLWTGLAAPIFTLKVCMWCARRPL